MDDTRWRALEASRINLHLDHERRGEALQEAAGMLRALGDLPEISEDAERVLRHFLPDMRLPDGPHGKLTALADELDPPQDTALVVEAFLEATEGRMDAIVDSDVDGLKGRYALRDGKVVRLLGSDSMPYEHGAQGLRRIVEDGAYAIE